MNPQNQLVAFPEFASLYTGPSFYNLCEESRRRRKPVLVLMIRSKTSLAQHNTVHRSLLIPEHIRTTINNQYLVYGIYERATDENLNRALPFPAEARVALFVLFVHHDANIQVASRLAGRGLGDFSASLVSQFLDENMQLFNLIAEEDPEYRRVSILQDAGLLPVTPGQNLGYQGFGLFGETISPPQARPRAPSNGALMDETRMLKERQKRELEEAQFMD